MSFLSAPPSSADLERSAEDVSHRFPEATEGQLVRGALALRFGGRPDSEIESLLRRPGPWDAWEESVFARNLGILRSSPSGFPRVASLQFPFIYDGQMASIARALRRRPDLAAIHLVVGDFLHEKSQSRLRLCGSLAALVVPRPESLEAFSGLDLVFLNEGFPCPWIGRRPVRVGLPHAWNNPPEANVLRYGGGAWFDVLFSAKRWGPIDPDRFVDLCPPAMVEHGADNFCVAVAGSPHFDEVFETCAKVETPRRKIVYHLSLEQPQVYRNLRSTIGLLLEKLPQHEIVLRPHPIERERPDLLEAVAPFAASGRFRISTAPSYVEDYADAQSALVHAPEPIRNFPLASLRPLVHLDPTAPGVARIPLGWTVPGIEPAIALFAEIDRNPGLDEQRLEREREREIPHPGRSVDHILDHIDDLVARRPVAGWSYHRLWSEGRGDDSKDGYLRARDRSRELGHPCLALLQSACKVHPDAPEFHLERAASFLESGGEGLLHDRWGWSAGLEHAVAAWDLLQARPVDDDLRLVASEWIRSKAMPLALAWCWKESQEGGPGKAAEIFSRLLSHDADGRIPRLWPMAQEFAESMRRKEADRRRLASDAAEGWARLGAERMGHGFDEAAREALEKALSLDPDHANALFDLMLLDRIQGRLADAVRRVSHLTSLLPQDPEIARHAQELGL